MKDKGGKQKKADAGPVFKSGGKKKEQSMREEAKMAPERDLSAELAIAAVSSRRAAVDDSSEGEMDDEDWDASSASSSASRGAGASPTNAAAFALADFDESEKCAEEEAEPADFDALVGGFAADEMCAPSTTTLPTSLEPLPVVSGPDFAANPWADVDGAAPAGGLSSDLNSIVALQQADGSWLWGPAVRSVVGAAACDTANAPAELVGLMPRESACNIWYVECLY